MALYQKINDIMKDVLETHAKEIQKFDWDNGPRKDSPLTAIIKAMLSIQKVLGTYLQTHPVDLRKLFSKIATMYISRMKTGMLTLQPKYITNKRAIKNIKEDVVAVTKQLEKWSDMLFDDINLKDVENSFVECFVTPNMITVAPNSNGASQHGESIKQ